MDPSQSPPEGPIGPEPETVSPSATLSALRPGHGTALVFLVFILLVTVGVWLQGWSIYPGLLLTEVGLLLIPTLFFCRFLNLRVDQVLGLRPPADGTFLLSLQVAAGMSPLASAMAMGLTVPVVLLLLLLGGQYPGVPLPLSRPLDYFWALGVGALVAAVCEELLFRGFLLQALRPYGVHLAVWTVAVCFGLFHMDPVRFFPTTALGVIFGYLTVYSGSIYPAMLAHATNNGLALSAAYFFGSGENTGEALNYEVLRDQMLQQFQQTGIAQEGVMLETAVQVGLLTAAAVFLFGGMALAALLFFWFRWFRKRRQTASGPWHGVPLRHYTQLFRDGWLWGISLVALVLWGFSLSMMFGG